MSDKMISLILNVGIFILALIGVILIVNAMGTSAEKDLVTGLYTTDTAAVDSSVAFSLYLLYGGGILIAGFTLWAIAMNPKKFIPTAIGLAVFFGLIGIAYSMVTVETEGAITRLEDATESSLMWGGLGIQATYVLVIVAIGLIVMQMGRGIMGYFQK